MLLRQDSRELFVVSLNLHPRLILLLLTQGHYKLATSVLVLILLLFVVRRWVCSLRERRKHPPVGQGRTAIPSPSFLHPIRILGMQAHMPGLFLKPPSTGFKPQYTMESLAPSAQHLTTVLKGQPHSPFLTLFLRTCYNCPHSTKLQLEKRNMTCCSTALLGDYSWQ